MKKEEFYDTNYNLEDIEMDPRFIICEKEMKLVLSIQILFTIICVVVAYILGKGNPSNYSYIMGFPAWWFGVIAISVIFTAIVIYIVKFKLVNMSLTDEVSDEKDAVKEK